MVRSHSGFQPLPPRIVERGELIRVADAEFGSGNRLATQQPLIDRQVAWHAVVDDVDLADVAPNIGLRCADESDASEPQFECFADSPALECVREPDVGQADVVLVGSVKGSQSVVTDEQLEIPVAQRPGPRGALLVRIFWQADNE